jgi:uncharacterized membrane protein YeaQ/YmgE (transglycosylase-associated protein family)
MGILGFIILGLIAGAIAKALHSGPEPGGILGTLLVGVVGAIVGGLVASALDVGGISSFFSFGTWVFAIVGAFVFLVLYSAVVDRDSGDHGPAREV